MNRAPMLIPFMAIGCGILSASYSHSHLIGAVLIIVACFLYFRLCYFTKTPALNYKYSSLHALWVFLCFMGIGHLLAISASPTIPDFQTISKQKVAVGIVKNISNKTSGDVIEVDIVKSFDQEGRQRQYDNFKAIIYTDAAECKVDQVILFPSCGLKRIKDSGNSFIKGYTDAMTRRGIYYSCRVPFERIHSIDSIFSLRKYSLSLRDKIVSFIEKQSLKPETKRFIIPILTNDRSYLEYSTRQIFSDAGVSHVLALSGLHVGIIAGMFLFIFFPFNFVGKYKLRFFLTAVMLWIYAFITGMSPSITRACIMSTVFIVSILLERKNNPINSLLISGFLILLISPMAIYDIGFQLSFLCVGSIIVFSRKFNPIDHRTHPRTYYLFGIILTTLIATFSSWIVTGYYFGNFPSMFLLSNAMILPFLPLYFSLIILFLTLSSIGLPLSPLSFLIDKIYEVMIRVVSIFGNDYLLSVNIPGISVFLWIAGIMAFGFLLGRLSHIKSIGISFPFFLLSIVIILIYPQDSIQGIIFRTGIKHMEISVTDGKGERIYKIPGKCQTLITAHGYKILAIDTQKVSDYKTYTDFIGDSNLDYVIIGGNYKGELSALTQLFNPKKIIIHASFRKEAEKKLLKEADSLSLPIHSLRIMDALQIEVPPL